MNTRPGGRAVAAGVIIRDPPTFPGPDPQDWIDPDALDARASDPMWLAGMLLLRVHTTRYFTACLTGEHATECIALCKALGYKDFGALLAGLGIDLKASATWAPSLNRLEAERRAEDQLMAEHERMEGEPT